MESYLISNQVNEIKANLVRFITTGSVSYREPVLFSRPVIQMYLDNPDMVVGIYGIREGVLMFDTPYAGLETVDLGQLNLETLIKIKEQIEYAEKSKQYSR